MLTFTNQGGIGKVQVFVNGKELVADARGPRHDPNAAETTLDIDLSAASTLMAGKSNEVTVIAYNREGFLSSRSMTVHWVAPGETQKYMPDLYAIVCGVSVSPLGGVLTRLLGPAQDLAAAAEQPDCLGRRTHREVLTSAARLVGR